MSDGITSFMRNLGRPVTIYPALNRITGSSNATIFLCQLVWWEKHTQPDADGWVYKTKAQWTEETGLSRREQDTARSHLSDFVVERYDRLNHRMYYRANDTAIDAAWAALPPSVPGDPGYAGPQELPTEPDVFPESQNGASPVEAAVLPERRISASPKDTRASGKADLCEVRTKAPFPKGGSVRGTHENAFRLQRSHIDDLQRSHREENDTPVAPSRGHAPSQEKNANTDEETEPPANERSPYRTGRRRRDSPGIELDNPAKRRADELYAELTANGRFPNDEVSARVKGGAA